MRSPKAAALAACVALGLGGVGPAAAVTARSASQTAVPVGAARAVATGDFDGDGVADLAVGYAAETGGSVAVFRGNVDAIYPNTPDAADRRASGAGSSDAFLADPTVVRLPVGADLLVAGDFDGDGRTDLVAAARGGTSVVLLPGDGHGSFGAPLERQLDGTVTALAAGEFGRRGGGTSLAVGVAADAGAHALLFAGAFDADATSVAIAEPASALVFTAGADGLGSLVIAAGSHVARIAGETAAGSTLEPAARDLAYRVVSLAQVDGGVAALDDAGALHLLRGASVETWTDEVAGTGWTGAVAVIAGEGHIAVVDPSARQLHVVSAASAAKRASEAYDIDGTPVAAAAMRLNADAIADFAAVTAESSTPVVSVSKVAATFTVTTNADDGPGSLRQAILDANANAGADVINFNIAGNSTSIALASPLPAITDPVTIDATTQTGFNGTPIVELNGTGAGANANGLTISAGSTTVRGLVINRFSASGIRIDTADNNVIEGNYIGTNVAGTTDLGNGGDGILIVGSGGNRIGGTTAAARNVISGNQSDGIQIDTAGATGNVVEGNYVGVSAAGNAAIPNSGNGIVLGPGVTNTTIGGNAPAAGNVISGNTQNGIDLLAVDVTGTVIQNNRIGVNAGDTAGLGNGQNGVLVNSSGNSITGNRIAFNGAAGVFVSAGVNDNISMNSISDNTGLGIDLAPAGVTPNDPTDADTGPNNLQNFPVLTSAQSTGNATTVIGTLTSTPSTQFRIEFYLNAACDASGNGEGATFLGFSTVTTNAQGTATIDAMLAVGINSAQAITAIAIDPTGNTSEFSACSTVATSADLAITKTGSPGSVPTGNTLVYTITVSNAGPLAAQNVTVLDSVPSGTTFISTTQSQGTCDVPPVGGTGALICHLGTINAAASATITLTVRVTGPAGLTITNTAFVQSTTPDANAANNTVTSSTLVIEPPDITSVTKLQEAGKPFRIKITGTNFEPGVQVFIGNDVTPWPDVKYKDTTMLVVRKGGALKARFPKGVPVQIRVVNPDGGQDTATFTR